MIEVRGLSKSAAPRADSDTNHAEEFVTSAAASSQHAVAARHDRRVVAPSDLARLVGLAAVAFPVVYLMSDIIEVAQGRLSTFRLSLTYVGEAAIPLFMLGLCAVQRPRIGRLGLFGAAAYAYSYVFFTSTVVYALMAHIPDYDGVTTVFGAWMVVHGVIMLIGGAAFGIAVMRARVLPWWTGLCLAVGVSLVAAASGLPTLARTVAEAVPAAAFIGMGCALLRDSDDDARS